MWILGEYIEDFGWWIEIGVSFCVFIVFDKCGWIYVWFFGCDYVDLFDV